MSWTDNLIQYYKEKKTGICPKCGSHKIRVEETNIGRKSFSFYCEECGSSAHFDGVSNDERKKI